MRDTPGARDDSSTFIVPEVALLSFDRGGQCNDGLVTCAVVVLLSGFLRQDTHRLRTSRCTRRCSPGMGQPRNRQDPTRFGRPRGCHRHRQRRSAHWLVILLARAGTDEFNEPTLGCLEFLRDRLDALANIASGVAGLEFQIDAGIDQTPLQALSDPPRTGLPILRRPPAHLARKDPRSPCGCSRRQLAEALRTCHSVSPSPALNLRNPYTVRAALPLGIGERGEGGGCQGSDVRPRPEAAGGHHLPAPTTQRERVKPSAHQGRLRDCSSTSR